MHAITVSDYGAGPAVTELPRPRPKPGQVLIAVQAAGLNPMDMEIANGGGKDPVPAPFPMVLRGGPCGTVGGDGPGVPRRAPGALVFRQPSTSPACTARGFVAVGA